tara:strand:- start:18 stop:146 length:129 start_codon:yes stop_codon:yes gene_type:complete
MIAKRLIRMQVMNLIVKHVQREGPGVLKRRLRKKKRGDVSWA